MKDEIFWGNLKGLLKTGKWTLNIDEASALLLIFKEAEMRSRPLVVEKKKDPIRQKGINDNK